MSTNTKTVIIDAFLELLKTKEFSKVSITDITEKCNSSRQTFYYHFDNIEDMLEWAFDEQTKNICSNISKCSRWRDAVEPYADFLTKYSLLLRSGIYSENCIMVLDLLKKTFYAFYDKYLTQTTSLTFAESNDFFVNCCASAMLCYVVDEAKKDNPNFEKMLDELYAVIKKYGFSK